jgi:hypothetical protein
MLIFVFIGEGKGYKSRVYLIYDGIHYDPLASIYTSSNAKGEKLDVFQFSTRDTRSKDKAVEVYIMHIYLRIV